MSFDIKWPDGKRIAIMMAFDLDCETLWESNHQPADELYKGRGSYGAIQGVPRILNMLDKYDIKATFFIPGISAERYPEAVKDIARCGHEIAYHGYIHQSWPDREREHADMLRTEKIIFDLTGKKIVGQRGPDGGFFDFLPQLLIDHGYIYSSNFRNTDDPFIHRIDGKEVPLVELPKDSIFDDTAFDLYAHRPYQTAQYLRSARDMCNTWRREFDALADIGSCINFVIHPQFIGHASRMLNLDKLVGYMKDNGAWFETNENVARYILKQKGFTI